MTKVNDTISGLIIVYNFFRFSPLGIILSISYNVISRAFLSGRVKILKRRIGEWDDQILRLESTIQEQMMNVAEEGRPSSGSAQNNRSSAGTASKYVDAEIIREYPNQDQTKVDKEEFTKAESTAKNHPGTIKEAKDAFEMLDKLEGTIRALEGHDHEIGILFRNAYQSAVKTADFIRENPSAESKMYLYYNHVDTLYDWAENLLELENNDVYESLLVNVKNNARKALPILQGKIDKEYFKLVNPKIMDLEAEMEVMSKEQY